MQEKPVNYIASAVACITTAVQSNEIFSYVSLTLTILSIVVSLTFTIYRWYKVATNDGKIDNEEIDELMKNINEGINELNDAVNNFDKKENEENEENEERNNKND